MLKILGRVTSINVRKVLWAADELGLAYEREDWGMPVRDPKVPEFLALNPNGLAPVLVEDDFVVAPDTSILNAIITRMNRRNRATAIIVNRPSGIPRPEDIVGIIDSNEIAGAVIANHYA